MFGNNANTFGATAKFSVAGKGFTKAAPIKRTEPTKEKNYLFCREKNPHLFHFRDFHPNALVIYYKSVIYKKSPSNDTKNQTNIPPGKYISLFVGEQPNSETNQVDGKPKLSLLQYRLYKEIQRRQDYSQNNSYYYAKMDNQIAKKTDPKDQDKSDKPQSSLFGPAQAKETDFSKVFENTATNSCQIPTAEQYFIPLKKAQLQSIDEKTGPSNAPASTQRPFGSARAVEEQYLVSASITRDYDYLFQSTSTSTINFTPIEQKGITIDHNQLRTSQPLPSLTLLHADFPEKIANMKVRIDREEFGSIDFLTFAIAKEKMGENGENQDLTSKWAENFKQIFTFEHRSIIIHKKIADKYEFDYKNQAAIITLENIVPTEKYSTVDDLIEQLKEDCDNKNLTFIDYNEETKQFVFLTPGFENCPFIFLS